MTAHKSPKDWAKRKTEGMDQVAKRQANLRARRKAEGRVRLELWPFAENAEVIRKFAREIEAQTNIKITGGN